MPVRRPTGWLSSLSTRLRVAADQGQERVLESSPRRDAIDADSGAYQCLDQLRSRRAVDVDDEPGAVGLDRLHAVQPSEHTLGRAHVGHIELYRRRVAYDVLDRPVGHLLAPVHDRDVRTRLFDLGEQVA